jgi:hypothetical protein
MIQKALEYLVNLGRKEVKDVHGRQYATGDLGLVPEPEVAPIELHTLSGVVDYIKSNIDAASTLNGDSPWLVVITSPTSLFLTTKADDVTYGRNTFIRCNALIPSVRLNNFMDAENFNIMLQSMFVDDVDRAKVLKVIGNIKDENVQNTADDGVSQKVTAKVGVSLAQNISVPNPVHLAPYRTFTEVAQPVSQFVLRLKNGPECALFEADGGAWKPEAMANVKEYFKEQLSDLWNKGKVHIIS